MATTFKYKAMDESGRMLRGTIDAANPADLERRLAKQGLDLISCRGAAGRRRLFGAGRVPRHELVNFTFHLEQLIAAGVSIVDGLRDLRKSIAHPRMHELAAEMVTSIEGGRTLSEALSAFPDVFGSVYVSMVRVGEQSGRLAQILGDLVAMLRWQDELAAQARRVLLYPVFVGVIVIPAVVLLMVLLVPQLTGLLAVTGGTLPVHTKILLAVSGFLVDWWSLVLAAPVVTVAGLTLAAGVSRKLRYLLDGLALRLWVLGPILRKLKIARFANYFALMYASGITVLESIALSRELLGNAVLEEALTDVHRRIADGGGISSSFARSWLFPALVVRMLKVGETSGAMDQALLNVSYFYDRQVRQAIGGITTLLGPVMVLVIAALLGWIVISILPPLYAAVTAFPV